MEVVFERPGHTATVKQFDAVPTSGDTVFLDQTVYDVDAVTWDVDRDVVVVDLSP